MNKERRKAIQSIISRLEEIKTDLSTVADEEQSYFDEMPENFQEGERGLRAEEVVCQLETQADVFDDIVSELEEASA